MDKSAVVSKDKNEDMDKETKRKNKDKNYAFFVWSNSTLK